MKVITAVLVRRYSSEVCDSCGSPIMQLPDELELGTQVQVDLDSKHAHPVQTHGGRIVQVDMVRRVPDGALMPCEMFMRAGRYL